MHKNRITADFDILKGNKWKWMFIDKCSIGKSGYISYRNVIIRAIFSIAKKGLSKEECKDKFMKFKAAYDDKKSYDDQCFLRIYYYNSNTDLRDGLVGALIEDQTNGCYPLMIKFDDSKRNIAFKNALKDIRSQFDQIWRIISNEKRKKWSRKIEIYLDDLYNCPSK